MARGSSFGDSAYGGPWSIPSDAGNATPVAKMILSRNGVDSVDVVGSSLLGYDIKAQDCVTMLKLSLLAESIPEGAFGEVYCNKNGYATYIQVGTTSANEPGTELLVETQTGNYVSKVDHVLVRARQKLPTRFWRGCINLMGGGAATRFVYNCGTIGRFIKGESLGESAWAEFDYSPQSENVRHQLEACVQRSRYQTMVGYKYSFGSLPCDVSMSISQTSPRQTFFTPSNISTATISFDLGMGSIPDGGGIVDISSVSAVGAAVVDLVKGSDLLAQVPELKTMDIPFYDFNDTTYYCLLDNRCTLNELNRGQNWFVLRGGGGACGTIATVEVVPSASYKAVWEVFNSMDAIFFRRKDKGYLINSVADLVRANLAEDPNDPFASFSDYAAEVHTTGIMVAGLNDKGYESTQMALSYTVAKPSVAVRDPGGNALGWADHIASNGFRQYPVIVQEEPPHTGHNGADTVPPPPRDEEGEPDDYREDPINELNGAILDITAPFLDSVEAAEFSGYLLNTINADTGMYTSYSYAGGGSDILPGMKFKGKYVYTVEFMYADKDSITTNVTTGPKYMPIGSYSQSQYVKRTETITRNGIVVGGSSESGEFTVDIEGRGMYMAYNQLLEPIYPGDKVEVKLMNVPVEQ